MPADAQGAYGRSGGHRPDRNQLNDSFLFELPWSWTEDSLRLRAELNPYKAPPEPQYGDNNLTTDEFQFLVSPHFKVDVDFNGLLLGVDHAAPLIRKLESKHANLAIVESPIPQADVAGNTILRRKIATPMSFHFGNPPAPTAVRERVCDGFVISGGATAVRSKGNFAHHHDMPFWLQLVGTGLTTFWSVHLGAVLKNARWPYIPCINIYEHPLIDNFTIEGGHVPVPEEPGLGAIVNEDAIERYRVEKDFVKVDPRQIHTIHWPDGRDTHHPNGDYRDDFLAGTLPGFLPGVSLDRRVDDGSEEFDRAYRDLFGSPAESSEPSPE